MSEWKDTKTGRQHCPCCNEVLDQTSSPDGAVPEPGDITLCGYCAVMLIFEADMAMRELTQIEFDLIDDEEFKQKLKFYQQKILELK